MRIRRLVRPGLKKVLPEALAAAAKAHPDKRIRLFFQDKAQFGQKGWACRRWWLRGHKPTGPVDQRYTFVYGFAAVEPATGRDFCLVLPTVSTVAMNEFLRRFSVTLAEDEHVVMVLDDAGWHTSHALAIPANLSLLRLPAYAPALNPVERIWLYLRERHLSHRMLEDYQAILDAVCKSLVPTHTNAHKF